MSDSVGSNDERPDHGKRRDWAVTWLVSITN